MFSLENGPEKNLTVDKIIYISFVDVGDFPLVSDTKRAVNNVGDDLLKAACNVWRKDTTSPAAEFHLSPTHFRAAFIVDTHAVLARPRGRRNPDQKRF